MDPRAERQGQRYLDYYRTIMESGIKIYPRGEEVLEVSDLQLVVDPAYPFMAFKARKYPINYAKKEILWFLGADPRDTSICEHAKMWSSVINSDGTFNSNYGVYWFGDQMGAMKVALELIRDPDSRRAVIPMLRDDHMTPSTRDVVCTECIGFRLRTGEDGLRKLHMSVHMRSSDAIFGMGTDLPTFAFLYRIVAGLIHPHFDNSIFSGDITVTVMSGHIYSRHYSKVNAVLDEGIDGFEEITMPYTKVMESQYLLAKRGKMSDVNSNFNLCKWLLRTSP